MKQPVWHRHYRKLPEKLRNWLLDTTSLTQRLRLLCPGQFHIRVLMQCWQRPLLTESRLLHIPLQQYVRVRHVYLCCQQRPLVFARTVIPQATLSGSYRRLVRLGTQPLGAILFSHHKIQRGDLHIACLQPEQSLYTYAVTGLNLVSPYLWARRSIFHLRHKSLLINEVFLPTLFDA